MPLCLAHGNFTGFPGFCRVRARPFGCGPRSCRGCRHGRPHGRLDRSGPARARPGAGAGSGNHLRCAVGGGNRTSVGTLRDHPLAGSRGPAQRAGPGGARGRRRRPRAADRRAHGPELPAAAQRGGHPHRDLRRSGARHPGANRRHPQDAARLAAGAEIRGPRRRRHQPSDRPLRRAKAGVGSAVNDTTRQMGGAVGVAVFGSIMASHFTSSVTDKLGGDLPARILSAVGNNVLVRRSGSPSTRRARSPRRSPAW